MSNRQLPVGTTFAKFRLRHLRRKRFDLILEPVSNTPVRRATIVIPYDVKVVTLTEEVLRRTYSDWRQGSFLEAFPELAGVSGEFESIPIEGIVDRVRDLQTKGEQVIELFGLKIPTADVTRWGVLLLLAVQFYFALHLYELTARIAPSDPGFEVAWIGLYESRAALGTTLLSTGVLPFITACLIAGHVKLGSAPATWMARSAVVLASGLIAAATMVRVIALRHSSG